MPHYDEQGRELWTLDDIGEYLGGTQHTGRNPSVYVARAGLRPTTAIIVESTGRAVQAYLRDDVEAALGSDTRPARLAAQRAARQAEADAPILDALRNAHPDSVPSITTIRRHGVGAGRAARIQQTLRNEREQ